MKLSAHTVEKPWGRSELPPQFTSPSNGTRIGEVWFEAPDGRQLPLLVKYIFTSERLSVQVHPNDAQARARGLPNGKTECWYILDAEEGATLALGFRQEVDEEALRAAALDGSIETLLDWKPVRAGDFFYVPANTVHAIGAGISLIEVQQQSDTTYRLYDYGRPRELHLDDGLALSNRGPYPDELLTHVEPGATRTLVPGPHFTLVYVEGQPELIAAQDRFAIPLRGTASAGGDEAAPGHCLFVPEGTPLSAGEDAALLVAAL
ncbi:MAG TPA: class I mannose-6-phosphate isomerase [Allosphingosinicella sp.]|jgi:mannose-6-phosphate isomerase